MSDECIAAETHYINISTLNSLMGNEAAGKMFTQLSETIQETVRLLPGMEHFTLRFCNILERDMNPDGNCVFFRVINHPPPEDFVVQFNIVTPPIPVTKQANDPKLFLGE